MDKYVLAISYEYQCTWSDTVESSVAHDRDAIFAYMAKVADMEPHEIDEVFVFDEAPEVAHDE